MPRQGNLFRWQTLPRWRVAAIDRAGRPLHDYMHAEDAAGAASDFAQSHYALSRGAVVTGVQRASA